MVYAEYAAIYEAIGQGAFAEQLAGRVLASMSEPPQRALDLACGTGAASLVLAAAGAEVVGVDRSPQMLAIAGAKARDRRLPVTFVQADLRRLPLRFPRGEADRDHEDRAGRVLSASPLLPASFDLITCLYDSMNYLTGEDDLARALEGAAQLLRPGGRLVFDLNTEHEFARWDESDQVVHDAGGIFVYNRLSYAANSRLAHGRIVWFVREGERWWRGEEQHVERAWADHEVATALGGAGLRLVARRTPRWEPAPEHAPRMVYEATREA